MDTRWSSIVNMIPSTYKANWVFFIMLLVFSYLKQSVVNKHYRKVARSACGFPQKADSKEKYRPGTKYTTLGKYLKDFKSITNRSEYFLRRINTLLKTVELTMEQNLDKHSPLALKNSTNAACLLHPTYKMISLMMRFFIIIMRHKIRVHFYIERQVLANFKTVPSTSFLDQLLI